MDQNKKQAIALMRYSAIAPVIAGTQDDYESMSAYFRAASAKGIAAPDGQIRHYSPSTIHSWYLDYKHGGFDSLIPAGRSDCGVSRKIDDELQEEIRYLKHTYPRLSAAAIYKQLQDKGSIKSGQLSESTICRFINQAPHSSLKNKSPQERFFSEPELIRRLSDEQIERSFLLEIERRVSADCVITIDQVEYEVDYRFAKQRITLRYTPAMDEIFIVESDGTLTPIRLLNKHENANVKRDKVRLTGGEH